MPKSNPSRSGIICQEWAQRSQLEQGVQHIDMKTHRDGVSYLQVIKLCHAHITWKQPRKTILVQGSKRIPHSSSLSVPKLANPPPLSLFLPLLSRTIFSSSILSNDTKSWRNRWRDGKITAAILISPVLYENNHMNGFAWSKQTCKWWTIKVLNLWSVYTFKTK